MLELVVLGSGTVAPTPHRTAAAYYVESGHVRLLLDCGPGALHRAASFGVDWPRITHVAITHFHADHFSELPFFLFAQRYGTEPARTDPLTVIGPQGLGDRLAALAQAYGSWVTDPGFRLVVDEIAPDTARDLSADVTLEATSTPHTAESLAYRVRDGTGTLVFTGDTGPSDHLADWVGACDLLLCECSLPDDRPLDIHLTPAQAGALATRAGARRLVLTHFYPPVEQVDPAHAAAATFHGPIVAARDGDRFTIGGS